MAENPDLSFDPYRILDLTNAATNEDIKRAYKSKARQYHPDKHPTINREFMTQLNVARDILCDSASREKLDNRNFNQDVVVASFKALTTSQWKSKTFFQQSYLNDNSDNDNLYESKLNSSTIKELKLQELHLNKRQSSDFVTKVYQVIDAHQFDEWVSDLMDQSYFNIQEAALMTLNFYKNGFEKAYSNINFEGGAKYLLDLNCLNKVSHNVIVTAIDDTATNLSTSRKARFAIILPFIPVATDSIDWSSTETQSCPSSAPMICSICAQHLSRVTVFFKRQVTCHCCNSVFCAKCAGNYAKKFSLLRCTGVASSLEDVCTRCISMIQTHDAIAWRTAAQHSLEDNYTNCVKPLYQACVSEMLNPLDFDTKFLLLKALTRTEVKLYLAIQWLQDYKSSMPVHIFNALIAEFKVIAEQLALENVQEWTFNELLHMYEGLVLFLASVSHQNVEINGVANLIINHSTIKQEINTLENALNERNLQHFIDYCHQSVLHKSKQFYMALFLMSKEGLGTDSESGRFLAVIVASFRMYHAGSRELTQKYMLQLQNVVWGCLNVNHTFTAVLSQFLSIFLKLDGPLPFDTMPDPGNVSMLTQNLIKDLSDVVLIRAIEPPLKRHWKAVTVSGTTTRHFKVYEKKVLQYFKKCKWTSTQVALAYINLADACVSLSSFAACYLIAGLWFFKSLKDEIASPKKQSDSSPSFSARKRAVIFCVSIADYIADNYLDPALQFYMTKIAFNLCYQACPLTHSTGAGAHQCQASASDFEITKILLRKLLLLLPMIPFYCAPIVKMAESAVLFSFLRELHIDYLLRLQHLNKESRPVEQHMLHYFMYINEFRGTISYDGSDNDSKILAMQSLLFHHKSTWNNVELFLNNPLITVDVDGWFIRGALKNVVFLEFKGIEVNLKRGHVRLITSEAPTALWSLLFDRSNKPACNLFNWEDFRECMYVFKDAYGMYFTLEQPNNLMPYHPFQSCEFVPKALAETNILQTLFHTDYLLKQLSMGAMISYKPPFPIKEVFYHENEFSQNFYKGIPAAVRSCLSPIPRCSDGSLLRRMHRLWIEAMTIEIDYYRSENVLQINFGNVNMQVKSHKLRRNVNGELVDDEDSLDADEAVTQFAKSFSDNYEEISLWYPEFGRLRQLCKMQYAAVWLHSVAETLEERLRKLISYYDVLNSTLQGVEADYRRVKSLQEENHCHVEGLGELERKINEGKKNLNEMGKNIACLKSILSTIGTWSLKQGGKHNYCDDKWPWAPAIMLKDSFYIIYGGVSLTPKIINRNTNQKTSDTRVSVPKEPKNNRTRSERCSNYTKPDVPLQQCGGSSNVREKTNQSVNKIHNGRDYTKELPVQSENRRRNCNNAGRESGIVMGKSKYFTCADGSQFIPINDMPSNAKSVVYLLKCCCCQSRYIGMTKREMSVRVGEHIRDMKSEKPSSKCMQHMKNCGEQFESYILAQTDDLRITEKQLIKLMASDLNVKHLDEALVNSRKRHELISELATKTYSSNRNVF